MKKKVETNIGHNKRVWGGEEKKGGKRGGTKPHKRATFFKRARLPKKRVAQSK